MRIGSELFSQVGTAPRWEPTYYFLLRLGIEPEGFAVEALAVAPVSSCDMRIGRDLLSRWVLSWDGPGDRLLISPLHLAGLSGYTPAMETTTLSEAALLLLHACVDGENPRVDASNLEFYRELATAGVMYPVSGMFRGPEANFRFTADGWRNRHEILASRAGSS